MLVLPTFVLSHRWCCEKLLLLGGSVVESLSKYERGMTMMVTMGCVVFVKLKVG